MASRELPQFFAYNPVFLRRMLYVALAVSVAVLAWAAADLHRGGGLLATSRAGLALGFTGLFGVLATRLRARAGYGVLVEMRGLTVSRPLGGAPHQVSWEDVLRVGKTGSALQLFLRDEHRILVPKNLFASASDFAALEALLDAVKPSPPLDS